MKRLLITMMAVVLTLLLFSSSATADWDKVFGGADHDYGECVRQTADGGYIIAGFTEFLPPPGGGQVFADIVLIKTDSLGNEQWSKTFGGADYDSAKCVSQTSDGGYIIVGDTYSFGSGLYDAWLIKTDADGNKEWDRTFGGPHLEYGNSVAQTLDGGFVIAGATDLKGAGYMDMWLVKTDAGGIKQWDRTFGGTGTDDAACVQQTSDGGYIMTGFTFSYGAGSSDIYVVKTDASGNAQWTRTLGGSEDDRGFGVQQTHDGGFIVAGSTGWSGAGNADAWLIKMDAAGNTQWGRRFGGASQDFAYSVHQTHDGGFILTGDSGSYGIPGGIGDDLFVIKTDSNGIIEWNRIFGSGGGDSGRSVRQTEDGGYIVAGVTGTGDSFDIWLIKIGGASCTTYYRDTDGDNYGITSDSQCLEGPSSPYTTIWDGDCDDDDPDRYPGNPEVVCNGIDEDCSEATPDDPNADGDPFSICEGDCDDNDAGVYPGSEEVLCNGKDDDCEPETPDGQNADGDPVGLCEGDCDDSDPGRYPGNPEVVCNGIDEDCSEATPDDPNADGDPVSLCEGDCDDTNPDRYPGNPEICGDRIDNDCDSLVDSDDPDCAGLSSIHCLSPANGSLLQSAPTFMWTADGGDNNRFAVDLSYDWTFSSYWSTYENLHRLNARESWQMPLRLWSYIPSGSYVYWRVRGADLQNDPPTIITSEEVWWFYKW